MKSKASFCQKIRRQYDITKLTWALEIDKNQDSNPDPTTYLPMDKLPTYPSLLPDPKIVNKNHLSHRTAEGIKSGNTSELSSYGGLLKHSLACVYE